MRDKKRPKRPGTGKSGKDVSMADGSTNQKLAKTTKRKRLSRCSMLEKVQQLRQERKTSLKCDGPENQTLYSELAKDAKKTLGDHQMEMKEVWEQEGREVSHGRQNQTRRAYLIKLRQAIAQADVVIKVLDVRDPVGYRDEKIEDDILKSGKRLILLLNKCDLMENMTVVDGWVKFLRKYCPCVAFRSMTTDSRSKNSSIDYSDFRVTTCPLKLLKSGYEPIGARELMGILNNYARQTVQTPSEAVPSLPDTEDDCMGDQASKPSQAKAPHYKSIVVAVIGMPNVGKSSVINSLCRNSNAVQTGNQAGITKTISKIKLSAHVELLDTPGVIMKGDETDAAAVLRGCVKTFDDSVAEKAVTLLRQIPALSNQFATLYGLSTDIVQTASLSTFLSLIAQRRRLLRKGGARDLQSAARLLIHDWQKGKLVAFMEPPKDDPNTEPAHFVPALAPVLKIL